MESNTMDNNCQLVVFSDKAYNAIIRETFEWDPVETGGILLGHVLDNGCWIVMEVLPPGYGEGREGDNVFHEHGYFEYNRTFVNYLAKSVAEQYEIPLELLGLWHRHPGSMDHFSGTDDGTNSTFAVQNPHGVISGLVNVDPQLRMTMYYLAHNDARGFGRPNYRRVDVEVGSDLIPEEYFKLRYYHGEERDLHPYAPQISGQRERVSGHVGTNLTQSQVADNEHIDGTSIIKEQIARNSGGCRQSEPVYERQNDTNLSVAEDLIEKIKKNKLSIILLLAVMTLLFFLSPTKCSKEKPENPPHEAIIEKVDKVLKTEKTESVSEIKTEETETQTVKESDNKKEDIKKEKTTKDSE